MDKPKGIDPLADRILTELARHPESSEIVLGGYVALQHYADYRQTHDIDAWWREQKTPAAEKAFLSVIQGVAETEGLGVRERRFGETYSVELRRGARKHFAFQISVRSVQLDPPVQSAWSPILIETLRDNIASKMNALVDRGTPRDLRDIQMVVDRGLASVEECWDLWTRKGPDRNLQYGKDNVLLHLKMLETRRPLASISDPVERRQAGRTRDWFRREFLGLRNVH